ncbi:MAG: hypothetical protein ABEJ07_02840 [Candidatus Nanohaloarchaea archaeon]
MERRHLLMVVGAVLIAGTGITTHMYINQNVELIAGMTPNEYQQKLSEFEEQRTSFEKINESPESFRSETVVVKGQVDISLIQENRYLIYPLLEREKSLYFTECGGNEPIGETAYLKGILKRLDSESMARFDKSNFTDEELENIEESREYARKNNLTTRRYLENESRKIWGIECRKIIPA